MIKKIRNYISNLLLIHKNPKEYIYWKSIKIGKKPIDYTRGAGYYLTGGWFAGIFPSIHKGSKVRDNMDGKSVILELIDYKNYNDPHDMTQWSKWHIIGYYGEKTKKQCTFKEYLDLYVK